MQSTRSVIGPHQKDQADSPLTAIPPPETTRAEGDFRPSWKNLVEEGSLLIGFLVVFPALNESQAVGDNPIRMTTRDWIARYCRP